MTQRESTPLEQALVRLFPSTWLRARARAAGVVRRRRKVDSVAFVWTLVFRPGQAWAVLDGLSRTDLRECAGIDRAECGKEGVARSRAEPAFSGSSRNQRRSPCPTLPHQPT